MGYDFFEKPGPVPPYAVPYNMPPTPSELASSPAPTPSPTPVAAPAPKLLTAGEIDALVTKGGVSPQTAAQMKVKLGLASEADRAAASAPTMTDGVPRATDKPIPDLFAQQKAASAATPSPLAGTPNYAGMSQKDIAQMLLSTSGGKLPFDRPVEPAAQGAVTPSPGAGPTGAAAPQVSTSSSGPTGAGGPPKSIIERAFSPSEIAAQKLGVAHIAAQGEQDQNVADAQQEEAFHRKTLMDQTALEDDEMQQQRAEKEAAFQKEMGDARAKQQELSDSLAQEKISPKTMDPDRLWNNSSTGQKILGVLSLALGGYAAGATGQNAAIPIMQQAIDRDLAAQKEDVANDLTAQRENLQTKKESLQNMKGLYAERMQAFGDERMADASARSDYWKGIQLQLDGFTAGTSNQVAIANAAKMKEAIAFNIDKANSDFELAGEQRIKAQNAAAAAAQFAAQQSADKERKAQSGETFKTNLEIMKTRATELGGSLKQLPDGTPVVVKDGKILETGTKEGASAGVEVNLPTGQKNALGQTVYQTGVADSKEDGSKAKELLLSITQQKEILGKIDALRDEYGGEFTNSDARSKAKAYAAQYQDLIKKQYGIKGNAPPSKEALDDLFPSDPLEKQYSSPFSDPNGQKLAAQRDSLDRDAANILQTYAPKAAASTGGVAAQTLAPPTAPRDEAELSVKR